MRPSVPDIHITDSQDAELAEYRALAGQAVLGLILGLSAPLAMVDPMLLSIPMLGLFFSWWALRRIKSGDTGITGRKMAITGLVFSLFFLAAAPGDWLVYRWLVRTEARQFSAVWFEYIMQDEPQTAFQLTVTPQTRRPLDDKLWAFYRNNLRQREQLESYVKKPTVRTLLALGPKAQVRFYRTESQTSDNKSDLVEQLYAVTYEEAGEKKSFFVLIRMLRSLLPNGNAGWRILQAEGGARPDEW